MKPPVALMSAYSVVDEVQEQNKHLQDESALCHHTIDFLRQALAETVHARACASLRWKQAAKEWRRRARRNAIMFRRSAR